MNALGGRINKIFVMVTMLVMLQCCCCVIPIRWRVRPPRFTAGPPQAVQQVNVGAQAGETLPDASTGAGILPREDPAQARDAETPSTLSANRTEVDHSSIAGVAAARSTARPIRTNP